MPLDVTDTEQIHQTCRKALAQYDINVLLNNADYGIMAPFERIPEDEICKLFETDVFGTMFVTQEFILHFKARRSGAILTTISLAAIIGLPSDGAYGAANQRKYLLAGNAEFPDATEAAKIIFEAATDGKDQINYPTDSVCKKLYEQYQSMGLESFKIYFGRLLYEEVT